jgi:hypothetical protein
MALMPIPGREEYLRKKAERRARLENALHDSPRRCPQCGNRVIGWDDRITAPTISKRVCRECGCKWAPAWRRRDGWTILIIGLFFGGTTGVGSIWLVYQFCAGRFEYVQRWYNLAFPRSAWPYVNLVLSLICLLLGIWWVRSGYRVIKAGGTPPELVEEGRPGGSKPPA